MHIYLNVRDLDERKDESMNGRRIWAVLIVLKISIVILACLAVALNSYLLILPLIVVAFCHYLIEPNYEEVTETTEEITVTIPTDEEE